MASTPANLPMGTPGATVLRENTRQRGVPPLIGAAIFALAGGAKRIGVTIAGSATTIPLYGYSSGPFAQACRANGWEYPRGVGPA